MFKKILTLTAVATLLAGLPVVANAGTMMTGTTVPTQAVGSLKTNALPMVMAHGQNGPITAPIVENNATKGNVITASVPLPLLNNKVGIIASGSGSNHFVGVSLSGWSFK